MTKKNNSWLSNPAVQIVGAVVIIAVVAFIALNFQNWTASKYVCSDGRTVSSSSQCARIRCPNGAIVGSLSDCSFVVPTASAGAQAVKCSAAYCAQFGQWCDESYGCRDSQATLCGNGVIDQGENCRTCPRDVLASGGKCDGSSASGSLQSCSPPYYPEGYVLDINSNTCVKS